jgi:AmmeMemoRadiSam system protein A
MSVVGAVIVPHPPLILSEVGRGEEKRIQKTLDAFREAARRVAAHRPETIVLTSPHAALYSDYFHISPGDGARGDMRAFGVSGPETVCSYDAAFVRELCRASDEAGLPAGTEGGRGGNLDHGTVVPLRFINEIYDDYKLVRIGLSGLSPLEHYRLGKLIAGTARKLDRRTVFIASGDLSHNLLAEGPSGFAEEGPAFDSQVTAAMEEGDFLRFLRFDEGFCESAAECGLRSFQIMAGALDGKAVRSALLSYEGPFGVGYGVAAFEPVGDDESRRYDRVHPEGAKEEPAARRSGEDDYVRLARLSLETYVRTGKRISLSAMLPAEMTQRRAGVFVSLKKNGQLRGCIGTIGAVTDCVASEIARNAVSSGCEDPRFRPVSRDELDELSYSVDVLGDAEDISSAEELDVKRYGVIVIKGRRRGLLLPNLEGVNSVGQQIAIAKQKAGIAPFENCSLQRFEVVRHT